MDRVQPILKTGQQVPAWFVYLNNLSTSLLISFISTFGLFIGSFLAAFSYRYPKNISIANGRSFCDKCHKQISWYDNIPVMSFIVLLGKCRKCKQRISTRYPLIELMTALGFGTITFKVLFLQSEYSIFAITFLLVVFCVLELIFIIDLENQIIPDSFTFFGILVSVLFFMLYPVGENIFLRLFAGFLAASFLMIIHLVTKGRGMGLGDVKFAILGGILTGVNLFLVWLFLSFLTGAVCGVILILFGKKGMKDRIAFGPFLVLGIGFAFIFGNTILKSIGIL